MASSFLKIFVFLTFIKSICCSQNEVNDVIEEFMKRIRDSQILKPDKASIWIHQEGLYPSYIHGNFAKMPEAQALRNNFKILDSNPFVTLWVNTIMLEATKLKNGPSLNEDGLLSSLKAVATYHDKNRPAGDGLLVFWPQSFNKTSCKWYCEPTSVVRAADVIVDSLAASRIIMNSMGMKKIWNKYIEPIQNEIETEMNAFRLPPDFDDCFLNIGLGSLLFSSPLHKKFFDAWLVDNKNFTYAFRALKKYAYKPFGTGLESLLDPRTYFYIRKYLHSIKDSKYPAAFVTTWTHFVTDDDDSASMPFHVNNIDLVVGANVIYGLTSSVLSQLDYPDTWFDNELQIVYENTTDLITWMVESNLSSRPDLALTYYPSIFNFYWFLSRTHNLLQTYSSQSPLPPSFPVLGRVMKMLSKTLRGTITSDLLERAIVDQEGLVHYQDFLGKDDRNDLDEHVDHEEDVLCSTAMALNTFLYTWMEGDQLVPNVPLDVKKVITGGSEWLLKYAKKSLTSNVVFSGSVKSIDDLPFLYPYNLAMFTNGTMLPLSEVTLYDDAVVAVKSLMSEEKYEEEVQKKHFGMYTPQDFTGFNSKVPFPFWSSKPFTYASVVLALAQYRELVSSGQLDNFRSHQENS